MKDKKRQIVALLKEMQPSEAIALIESIGKELRRKNSIRINRMTIKDLIDLERPDLQILKEN
jgi:hypothetical protein